MATKFKKLDQIRDVTATKTILHEVIPITGSLISGTYGGASVALGSEPHIKNYTHGMFQTVSDYPYLSSSQNPIFDITMGVWPSWSQVSGVVTGATEKKAIYNQMAQMLVGHDATGGIRPFDHKGEISSSAVSQKFQTAAFLNFSRLLVKDEIEKGSFRMTIGTGSYQKPYTGPGTDPSSSIIVLGDFAGTTGYKTNSPSGEYGLLYSGSSASSYDSTIPVGLVYYQAGIVVLELSSSKFVTNLFLEGDNWHTNLATYAGREQAEWTKFFGDGPMGYTGSATPWVSASIGTNRGVFAPHTYWGVTGSYLSASIKDMANGLRKRIASIDFRNSTELNSTIYYCRVNHNEFNYSSNPTYVTASKIRVKNNDKNQMPVAYATTIGLYSRDMQLLATAKLSEPLKKTPEDEFVLRVRLDY